jgi:outer membrane protein insertion porin family
MTAWVRVCRQLGGAAVLLCGLILGSATSSLTTATPAYAQGASAVVVQGNRRIEASTIQSYFRLEPGERLDEFKIDNAYKALVATGLFEDVKISRSGGRIIVTVVEAPVLNRVTFEGNRRVKEEQLRLEVQSKPRGTLSRPMVQADVQRIIEVYRASGRYDVRVEPKIIERPNNRVDLVFEINEGAKTTVKAINFVGNNAFSSGRLKDVIKTQESGILTLFKTSDIYDPDRLEADRELLRRYYLKNGYADIRIASAVAEYDPGQKGFIITFTIDEGQPYQFGAVDIESNVRDVDPASLRAKLHSKSGATYNAETVEKTVEDMTVELAKRGYAFAQIRPRGDRDFQARTIRVTFVVEQGPRVYIERINVRGNTRTRDYVIRREFDVAEGDAYNRALVDRAERRLKNLNFFKTVKITNEPGSSPDRVVVNVDVEEQPTGEFSIAGGYSTADGIIGEVSVGERNLLGRGQYARVAGRWGSYSKGFDFSFVEPYFLDYRLSAGLDLFYKETSQTSYQSYDTKTYGGALRAGLPLREDLTLQLRYSAYRQEISLPDQYNDCSALNPAPVCYFNGEASLAIKQAMLNGPVWTSLVGYSLIYNTLDNVKNPTTGMYAELRQDFAGVGGDVKFIRTTTDVRYYQSFFSDFVGLFRLQGGHIAGWGDDGLRMLDHFFLGPTIVRGFAPQGIGPRDLTPGTNLDALGGSLYWGATVEVQFPIFGVPKDIGVKAAVFADAGSLWSYKGPSPAELAIQFPGQTITPSDDDMKVRSSIGASIIWDSPFGPIRIDYAYALTKEECGPFIVGGPSCDKTQAFRFSGGTRF